MVAAAVAEEPKEFKPEGKEVKFDYPAGYPYGFAGYPFDYKFDSSNKFVAPAAYYQQPYPYGFQPAYYPGYPGAAYGTFNCFLITVDQLMMIRPVDIPLAAPYYKYEQKEQPAAGQFPASTYGLNYPYYAGKKE